MGGQGLFGALTGRMRGAVRYLRYALGAGVFMALPSAVGYLKVARVGEGFISLTFALPVLLTWPISVLLRMERLRLLPVLGVLPGLSGGLMLALGKAGTLAAVGAMGETLPQVFVPAALLIAAGAGAFQWARRDG